MDSTQSCTVSVESYNKEHLSLSNPLSKHQVCFFIVNNSDNTFVCDCVVWVIVQTLKLLEHWQQTAMINVNRKVLLFVHKQQIPCKCMIYTNFKKIIELAKKQKKITRVTYTIFPRRQLRWSQPKVADIQPDCVHLRGSARFHGLAASLLVSGASACAQTLGTIGIDF